MAGFMVPGHEPPQRSPQACSSVRQLRIGNPRILLAATTRWPLAARLAIAFHKLGCEVEAWCPVGHPLEKTRAVERIHRHGILTPQWSLLGTIRAARPAFIIPCDDDAAIQLHRLHESCCASGEAWAERTLIERSLGTPASCSRAAARDELMNLAVAEGVRTPAAGRLSVPADLNEWAVRDGFPAVVKLDRSCGGRGVMVVQSIEEARRAADSAAHPSFIRALSDLMLRRDSTRLLQRLRRERPVVTVQNFIGGMSANRAVACWQGEILAGISVAALRTQRSNGPATVVQIIDNKEMSDAATRMVRALGVSGFCGLDFVLEGATGAAHLIEINPRATPISHLALGSGQDLPAALVARLKGEPMPTSASTVEDQIIAMFPGEWRRDSRSPYLHTATHDVPWDEMDLVRDCVSLPWEERGWIARIRARVYPRRVANVIPFPLQRIRAPSDALSAR